MNKRILFVDDEQSVLSGLKRSLRGQQKEWDMSFALGGQAALDISEETHFDAIVTDLRMPGIDGLKVVEALVEHHPETIRIILSGHSDEKMIMKLTGLAHQFLAKPCDSQVLIHTLTRTFALKDLLKNERLQSLVAGMKSLPSIPVVYQEIMKQLVSPDCNLQAVGKTVHQDPAMTAKILQLVNSAFFGLGHHISDTGEAVTILGLDVIKALVLSIGIFSQFDEKRVKDKEFSIERLWQHSLKVADLAKRIAVAEKAKKQMVDDCFLAGLVHDIGILILEDNFSEEYGRVRELSNSQNISLYQAEHEIFGATHGAVGAYLLGLWSMSNEVVEAVAFHHHPELSGCSAFSPLIAVHAGDILEQRECIEGIKTTTGDVELTFLEHIGLGERLETWKSLRSEESKL